MAPTATGGQSGTGGVSGTASGSRPGATTRPGDGAGARSHAGPLAIVMSVLTLVVGTVYA